MYQPVLFCLCLWHLVGATTSVPPTTSHPPCPTTHPSTCLTSCPTSCPSSEPYLSPPCPPFLFPWIPVVVISTITGTLLIMAVTGMFCICRKHRDQTHEDKTDATLYKLTENMTESEMTKVIYTCFTKEQ